MDDLTQLENWVAPLLQKLEPKARKQLARTLGNKLRQSQRKRIQKQQNPDGSHYAPRKGKSREERQQRHQPVCFLYNAPGGEPRKVGMKSYADQGDRLTGFDVEARGLRTFLKARISQYLPIPPELKRSGGRIRAKAGRIKRQAMFKQMTKDRYLKNRPTANDVEVGFWGSVANIAQTHQYGQRAKVSDTGPEIEYERRELLGYSPDDLQMISDFLVDKLT